MKQKILVVAGGTGGHVFPAICFTEHLLKENHEVYFITDQRGCEYLEPYNNFTQKVLFLNNKQEGIVGVIIFALQLLVSFVQSCYWIVKLNPKKIVGFSGFPTVATLLAGFLLRKKLFVHEQNSILGQVNRFMLRFIDMLFISVPNTQFVRAKYRSKLTFVGMPVRDGIVSHNSLECDESDDYFKILVTSGSQGASSFAYIVPRAIAILPVEIRKKIQILHQVRNEDMKEARLSYDALDISYDVVKFIDDMPEQLSNSNLVIARAGASTIAEVCALGKPTIFVPYPYAKDNHQYHNAKAIEDGGGGWLLENKDFTPAKLAELLHKLLCDKKLLVVASTNIKQAHYKNSTQQLADNILSS